MPAVGGDPSLQRHVDEACARLAAVQAAAERAVEYAAQLGKLSRGFSLEQHARIALAIKDARDAVKACQPRLTDAQQGCDEYFAMRIAEACGFEDVVYRTQDHTFTAGARGFYSAPSQHKRPTEFQELLAWLRANGHEDKIDALPNGNYSIEGLDAVCLELEEKGQRLPPWVSGHRIDCVKIRRRGSQPAED